MLNGCGHENYVQGCNQCELYRDNGNYKTGMKIVIISSFKYKYFKWIYKLLGFWPMKLTTLPRLPKGLAKANGRLFKSDDPLKIEDVKKFFKSIK